MPFYVYMIKTVSGPVKKSYVGYSDNIHNRLKKHNSNRGAKSTKGHKWKIIYKKRFMSKSKAMSFEYYLKKNRKLKKKILENLYK